jgi:hypothetical protein
MKATKRKAKLQDRIKSYEAMRGTNESSKAKWVPHPIHSKHRLFHKPGSNKK